MDKSLCSLDLDTLRELYEKETSELKAALLRGVDWDEVRDQRHKVTDLAIAIHKKKFPLAHNPAETSLRTDRNQ